MSEEFDHYLDGVYKVPSLSNKEEIILLNNIRNGDVVSKKTLVL